MPGANYFLSQVAAQTPGPLLGAIVPPKLSPPQCLELISTPRTEPFHQPRIDSYSQPRIDSYNQPRIEQYNQQRIEPYNQPRIDPYNQPRIEPYNQPRTEPYISAIGSKTNTCRDGVPAVPSKHVSGYGNRAPKPSYNHSYSPSPPPQAQAAPDSLVKAPPLPPTPPGLGTTDLPNVRKQDNPVGELQELCTKMRWVFPTYYIFCDEAQPHERAFCVVVRLYRFREKGEAKSKRAAKREAATRILNRLRSWPADVPLQINHNAIPAQSSKSNGMELMPFKPSKVHISPPPSYYINELSMLSQKHNFSTAYVKVEEPTEAGDIQFVLQLSTMPVVVINGSGRSLFLAKADAAKKALDCLRVMCKSYFARSPLV